MKDCSTCDHLPEDCISCGSQIRSYKNITLVKIYNDLQGSLRALRAQKLKLAEIKTSGVLKGIKKLIEDENETV